MAEGFVPFRGYRTWYRIVGDGEKRIAMIGIGPIGGHTFETGLVIASRDPVAADTVGAMGTVACSASCGDLAGSH